MSKLEELIQQYCPYGVEYIKLGDYFIQLNGMTGVTNKWADEGNCVFIDYMNAYKNIKIDVSALNYATVKSTKQTVLKKGDVLFTSASETPDECALASEIEDDIQDNVFMDDHLFGLRLKDEYSGLYASGFLKYVFRSEYFRRVVNKVVRGVTRFYISKTDFMRLEVPLPALPVQREIVRILDEFSLLSAELAAELAARKQQYEYYREKLMSFEDEVKRVTVAEIGDVTKLAGFEFTKYVKYQSEGNIIALRGLNVKNGFLCLDDVKYIDNSQLSMLNRSKLQDGDMLFTYVGTIGEVALIEENDKYYLAPNVSRIRFNKELVNPIFMKYYFQTSFFKQFIIGKLLQNSSMKNIPMEKIRKFEVPLPPLQEQEKIVDILRKFDAITNDLTSGLPAEIEARQKQYEYYRDKLLTFKRLES